MWWRVEVVGEPHGAELTGEGGSRRSREAEQSAARSVQLHACTGTSLHTCTQVRVYSVHSPLMRFFLLFSLFILKYECLFLNQSLSACSESVLLSEKSTQAHSASVICFTLFSIQENELQLRLSGGSLSGWSHVEVKNVSPSFILPLSLPSFPLCHSFRNLNVTSLRASISTSHIRRNNQRNPADVVFRLKTFPGCADWGFLSVQLLRDKAEEQLLRIQKPEIKHVCRSFRAECADSALLLLECLHFFWFLLLLLLRFDSLWRLFALSLQRQFVQTDRQTDWLSVGRLSAAPGFCVKVWSELQTDTTTPPPPPPSRHLIPEQLPSSLSPLPVVWFSFSLFSEAEIWSKRKTLEKNSSRIF